MHTRHGFYSAVWKGGEIQVRARVRADLERLIKGKFVPEGTKIIETANGQADYRYRILLTQEEWANASFMLAADIDYPNFKSEVMKSLGKAREHPLHDIWTILARLQPGGAYAQKGKKRWGLQDDHWLDDRQLGITWNPDDTLAENGYEVGPVYDHDKYETDRDGYLMDRIGEAFSEDVVIETVKSIAPPSKRKRKRGKRSGR